MPRPTHSVEICRYCLGVQELVEGTPAGKLVLYPQVFMTALALLDTPWVHLHAVSLHLFGTVRVQSSALILADSGLQLFCTVCTTFDGLVPAFKCCRGTPCPSNTWPP